MDKKAKIDLCNSLIQNTKIVTDFKSYLNYLNFVNQVDPFDLKNNIDRVEKIGNKRESFRWIFLGAYILGSILLLLGLKYE